MFSSSPTIPGVSFTAALRGRKEEQRQPQTHQVAVSSTATMEPGFPAPLPRHEQLLSNLIFYFDFNLLKFCKTLFYTSDHAQGKITPYADGLNNIQIRGKTITTTTGLHTENNTGTPGRYSIKNPKRGILNYII
jgi:hypothetical protein